MNEKKPLLYFAMGIIAACFAYFFAITFLPIPAGGQRYADLILGFLLGTACASVFNYYWGSSKGSQDKNDILRR